MNTKIIDVNKIIYSEDLYPRNKENWFLTNKYTKAILSGADFPMIVVGKYRFKYYLIDGLHRIKAYQNNGITNIQVIVKEFSRKEDMFAEAVKLNCEHGQCLSTQETVMCITKLREMKFNDIMISKIVSIPIENIENFVIKRITNTITGEEIPIKSTLSNLANELLNEEPQQNIFNATSQLALVEQLIQLFEKNYIDLSNKKMLNKLKILNKMIENKIIKKYRRK